MSQALIDQLKRENLCTHFVLPLLKLNKVSFNESGFVNCYLTKDLKRVVVKLVDTILLSRRIFDHPEFSAIYIDANGYYLITFRLRDRWADDLQLFAKGQYSQFSMKAKQRIINHSGLRYRKREGSQVLTDGRLLALEKHTLLREMWEREYYSQLPGQRPQNPDLHMPEEYLSVPGEESYINLDGLAKIREV